MGNRVLKRFLKSIRRLSVKQSVLQKKSRCAEAPKMTSQYHVISTCTEHLFIGVSLIRDSCFCAGSMVVQLNGRNEDDRSKQIANYLGHVTEMIEACECFYIVCWPN